MIGDWRLVIGLVGVNRELGKIGEILFARVFEPPLIDALALIQVNFGFRV